MARSTGLGAGLHGADAVGQRAGRTAAHRADDLAHPGAAGGTNGLRDAVEGRGQPVCTQPGVLADPAIVINRDLLPAGPGRGGRGGDRREPGDRPGRGGSPPRDQQVRRTPDRNRRQGGTWSPGSPSGCPGSAPRRRPGSARSDRGSWWPGQHGPPQSPPRRRGDRLTSTVVGFTAIPPGRQRPGPASKRFPWSRAAGQRTASHPPREHPWPAAGHTARLGPSRTAAAAPDGRPGQ